MIYVLRWRTVVRSEMFQPFALETLAAQSRNFLPVISNTGRVQTLINNIKHKRITLKPTWIKQSFTHSRKVKEIIPTALLRLIYSIYLMILLLDNLQFLAAPVLHARIRKLHFVLNYPLRYSRKKRLLRKWPTFGPFTPPFPSPRNVSWSNLKYRKMRRIFPGVKNKFRIRRAVCREARRPPRNCSCMNLLGIPNSFRSYHVLTVFRNTLHKRLRFC